jgi:2-dehydro-3-deoxy-D-arabinonate dehydratase
VIRLCRFRARSKGAARLGAVYEGRLFDLSVMDAPPFASLAQLLNHSRTLGGCLEGLVQQALSACPELGELDALCQAPSEEHMPHLLAPIDEQEVWAAGVTYVRSREARERESEEADVYTRVYDAPRPEIFFKTTPHRVSGPFAPVCVRSDSSWSVPEPELALVLDPELQLVGYTAANDMSARDIEGANPLYLPQAKIYAGCCALGPTIVLATDIPPLEIQCAIRRQGQVVFEGKIGTDQFKRSYAELIEYLGRDNAFPNGVILLTGTGIVPPDDFTLQERDVVSITIEPAGTLVNPVLRL